MVRAARLLGAVRAIRPAVAQTVVEIGVGLSSVNTMRNLQDGLRFCLAERKRRDAENLAIRSIEGAG